MACEICDDAPAICRHNAELILKERDFFRDERTAYAMYIDMALDKLVPPGKPQARGYLPGEVEAVLTDRNALRNAIRAHKAALAEVGEWSEADATLWEALGAT